MTNQRMRGKLRHSWCRCCDDGIRPSRTRERATWKRDLKANG